MKVSGRVSRYRLFAVLAVYAIGFVTPFFVTVTPVKAAVPSQFNGGSWQFLDRTHIAFIKAGNQVFQGVDAGIDRTIEYGYFPPEQLSKAAGGVCDLRVTSKLTSGAWDNSQSDLQTITLNERGLNQITVHWSKQSDPPESKCVKQPDFTTSIGNLANFNVVYSWISQNEIQRIDSADNQVYKNSGKTVNYPFPAGEGKASVPSTLYLRENENGCTDFIIIPKSGVGLAGDNQFAYYEEIDSNGHGGDSTYPGDSSIDCKIVVSGARKNAAYITVGRYTVTRDVPDSGPRGKADEPNCPVVNTISFIVCPFIQVANDFYGKVKEVTVDLLNNGTLDTSSKNVANAKKVHDSFKNMTNILFVLIFLVIIFSTTLSIGIDNYNIKKMLPRLVAAVILVQFSWVLMQLAFDVTNILAAGIASLPIFYIDAPTGGSHITAASYLVGAGIGGLFIGTAIAAGLIIPFLLMLAAAVIGILGVLLTLIIRQFIIIVLVVLAPVAFVAWVLPNTEGLFKTWSKMLMRLLLMYPMVVLIFSMAGLFSKIQPATTTAGVTGIVAAIIPIMAFYMVPWTFRWAGGAMNAVGGFVTQQASKTGRYARKNPLTENLAQSRKEKGFLQAQDAKTSIGRAFGRSKTGLGNVIMTPTARRKVQAGYQKTLGDLGKESRAKLQNELVGKSGDEGTKHLVGAATNAKASQFERQSALEMLSDRNAYPELEAIGSQIMNTGSDTDKRIWNNALQTNISTIATKAPQLITDKKAAFTDASGDRVANFHTATFGSYMDYLAKSTGPDGEAARKNAHKNLTQLQTSNRWGLLNSEQQTEVNSFLSSTNAATGATAYTSMVDRAHTADPTKPAATPLKLFP